MLQLLFFTGTYCPSCKAMYPIIESIEKDFKDQVVITRLNVEIDTEKTLNFNITSIPTIVFVKENKTIERFVGPQIKSKLVKVIQSYQ